MNAPISARALIVEDDPALGNDAILEKPFALADLERAMALVLTQC